LPLTNQTVKSNAQSPTSSETVDVFVARLYHRFLQVRLEKSPFKIDGG
jgi:hypothetical protein